MFAPDRAWNPTLDWNSPAGTALTKLLSLLPKTDAIAITVFGSSPLQLGVDSTFLSGDIDIFSQSDLNAYIEQAGLAKGKATSLYIEQVPETVFVASPTWSDRAFTVAIDNVTLSFPHPIDILVAKIKRLAEKDLNAYRLIFKKTGHRTEDELKIALRRVVDISAHPLTKKSSTVTLQRTPAPSGENATTKRSMSEPKSSSRPWKSALQATGLGGAI